MKLLIETIEDMQTITEDVEGKKSLYIIGPALVSEQGNKNGRYYPKDTLDNEVRRYMSENFPNRAVGELNHPKSPNIDPERISHKFVSLNQDGNRWIAKAKIIESNPVGKIVAGLLNEGIQLGFSSRGIGSLKSGKNGLQEVQNDFRLSTPADVVIEPSGPGCFVQGIRENTEWYFDASKGTWMEKKFDELVEAVKKLSSKEINEKKLSIFEYYINGLKKPSKND